jgi:hypothetical protein
MSIFIREVASAAAIGIFIVGLTSWAQIATTL